MKKRYLWFSNPAASEILVLLTAILLSVVPSNGDPRTQLIKMTCGSVAENNSTISASNFLIAMRNISNQIGSNGFGEAIAGTGLDASYGLAQCYADLSSSDCIICFAEAQGHISQCFPSVSHRAYLDGCFIRADNYSFFDEYWGPGDEAVCGNVTRNDTTFQESARKAVQQAVSVAGNNGGHATSEVVVSGTMNQSAYVLADCWDSLNMTDCMACLANASASVLGCLPSSEGRALMTGCFMRYSDTDFLNKVSGGGNSKGVKLAIGISVGCFCIAFVACMITGIYIWKRRRVYRTQEVTKLSSLLLNMKNGNLRYSYKTLEKATNYFSESNKLGQGGSGSVYKGVLPDGKTVAIKRLFLNTRQWVDHFFNEVDLISGIQHKNLVGLLGYSVIGPESLLVYEYIPNGSLQDHIFCHGKLSWKVRYNIISGIAEGLAHLHDESNMKIIHRDIKLSNILLDADYTAKIADFGLARLFPQDKTHVSITIVGTLGYMAPEYVVHGRLTEKADVYSFGVLVMEVVTGRRNNDATEDSFSILQMVWNLYGFGKLCHAVDPSLKGDFSDEEATRLLQIGLLCAQASAEMRPTMSMVNNMLNGNCEIPHPAQPPFLKFYNSSSAKTSPSFPSCPSGSYISGLTSTTSSQD